MPKTWAAAEFVDAAELNAHIRDNLIYMFDDRIVYAQRTSDLAGIGSLQTTIVTAPAFTPVSGSRILRVMARWRGLAGTNVGDIVALRLNEVGVGQINEVNFHISTTFGAMGGSTIHYVVSPTATAHTYAFAGDRLVGSGTFTVQGNSAYPIQIIVEDIGAA